MPITDKRVKSEKLGQHEKQKKISDGGGLFLLLKANKNGLGKYWRMAYRFAGKQKELALGVYPSVSLKEARAKTYEAKKLLENNIDPNQQRKDDRRTAKEKVRKQNRDKEIDINTFEVVARKWFELQKPNWDDSYSCTVISRLERYMFPSLGSISIAKISKFQFSNAIEDITALGIADTAKRITQYTRNILEFAYDRGLINAIPLGQTKNLVPVRVKTPLPAITDTHEIGRLLKAIDAYTGTFTVCSALKVLPYLAVRSGEFRLAKWDEFDFKTRLWTIPAAHRKLSKVQKQDPENVHLVPLSSTLSHSKTSSKDLITKGKQI